MRRTLAAIGIATLLLSAGCRHRTTDYNAPVESPGAKASGAPQVAATPKKVRTPRPVHKRTTSAVLPRTTVDTSPEAVKLMTETNVEFGIPEGWKFQDAPEDTLRYFGPDSAVIIYARLGLSNSPEAELRGLTLPWINEGYKPRAKAKKDKVDDYDRLTLDLVKGPSWSHFVAVTNGKKTLVVWIRGGDLNRYASSVEALDYSFKQMGLEEPPPSPSAAPASPRAGGSPSAAAASPSAAAGSPSAAASPTAAAHP